MQLITHLHDKYLFQKIDNENDMNINGKYIEEE